MANTTAWDDRNSVRRQILDQIWNPAGFSIVNEARARAPKLDDDTIELNGMFFRLFDHGFFGSQVAGIWRLTDQPAKNPEKHGVSSLMSIVREMQEHRLSITREAICKAERRPVDISSLRRAFNTDRLQRSKRGESTDYYYPMDLRLHELRHEHIDELCGNAMGCRGPMDVPEEAILNHLQHKLTEASAEVKVFVDKFIAHAATPESRGHAKADEIRMTFGQVEKANRVICEVASFLAIYFFGDAQLWPLATPQFNQFQYLDRPLVATSDIGHLAKKWSELSREFGGWGCWAIENCRAEMNTLRRS